MDREKVKAISRVQKGCTDHLGDILVCGYSKEKHSKHLKEMFKTTRALAPSAAKQSANSASILCLVWHLVPGPAEDSYGRNTTAHLHTGTKCSTMRKAGMRSGAFFHFTPRIT